MTQPFVNGSTLTDAGWFNDVNDLTYSGTFPTGITNLTPDANDGAAIGVSGTAWSDLFLASGAVINFAAGDVTITHASSLLTISDNVVVSGPGPNAIGGATNSSAILTISGSIAVADATGIRITSSITPNDGTEPKGIFLFPTINEGATGNHAQISMLRIGGTIVAGSGTCTTASQISLDTFAAQTGTTNAASIYVSAAPTGATNNYALWVDAGTVRIDGTTGAGASVGTLTNAPSAGDPAYWMPVNANGSTYYIPCWS